MDQNHSFCFPKPSSTGPAVTANRESVYARWDAGKTVPVGGVIAHMPTQAFAQLAFFLEQFGA